MAASEDKLGELHELVTNAYIKALKADGDPPPAALLTSAATFLKQNGITSKPDDDETLQELRRTAGTITDFPFDVDEDRPAH